MFDLVFENFFYMLPFLFLLGALGTNSMTTTTLATWIPEVWLPELRAFRERNLVAANVIKRVPFEGSVGDVLHIPDLGRLTVSNVTEGSAVTLSNVTESEFTGTVTRWRASAFQVPDRVARQAKYNIDQAYTQSAGKVIAEDIDSHILSLESGFQSSTRKIGSGNTDWDGSANTNTGNGADITDDGLLALIEILDLANVPQDGRFLIANPRQKAVFLGIEKFVEYQSIGPGMMPIRTGLFGEIYGIPVSFTTQTPTVLADDTTTTYDINLLGQTDCIVLAMQNDVRIQSDYELEFLSWLVVVDYLGQAFEFRDDHAVAIVSPQA